MRVLAVLGCALIATACISEELLKNPDFEEIGPNGIPAGWVRYAGGAPESRLEVVSEAYSGQTAVRLIDTGPEERDSRWAIGLQQDVAVTPGRYYEAGVYAKAFARNHRQAVILQLTFLPMRRSYSTYVTPKIGGDFQRFTIMGQAPPGAESVRLYIYTMHFWTSETIVDKASLRELPEAEANMRGPLLRWNSSGIAKARPVLRDTVLVTDGQPKAVIVPPKGKGYRDLARDLQRRVEVLTGARLPIATEAQAAESGANIIALGQMLNNHVIERLYWNQYCRADSLYPGPDGYVIRTVSEPYGFAEGQNVIVLAGSDLAGARKAVVEFGRQLADRARSAAGGAQLVVPHTLVVQPQPPVLGSATKEAAAAPGSPDGPRTDFTAFISYADLYLATGHEVYAELAKRVLLQCWDRYVADPDFRITWPEETKSQRIGLLWEAVESAPTFSDEERLTCLNTLLCLLHSLPRHCSYYGRLHDNDTIIWNHTTFPLMGIWALARYFNRFYGDVDGKMSAMLAEVEGAFRGQVKSWKPQEDADGYLTIVPRHTITYTLAEGSYEYFENGSVRKFAEYLTAVTDNHGRIPGFGDSGYGKGTGYELSGLPIAFWYYKDPRYLWRLKQTNPNWRNPYWQDIKPKPWTDLTGVKVQRLHQMVYDFTKTKSYYGEPVTPPNVPYEQAFDKITFRESLAPDSQFMLLDGYATGKHLHYDGNAIIKLSMLGDDALIDGDYLVRNTTEHNMVSIIRDGRATQVEPVCTALLNHADLPTTGFTRTMVEDWNGCDWGRCIFWKKGEWFAVIDEIEPKTPGSYALVDVWKTLDRGEQTLLPNGGMKTSIPGEGHVGNRDIIVVPHPEASGGKAVKFTTREAQVDFQLDLPRGEYALSLVAYGLDTGTDSFWVAIDGGEKIAFHIPVGKFGPSSSSFTKDQPTPNVRIPKPGAHRFTITLRENAGVMLDRIVLTDAKGRTVADMEAEDAPGIPKDQQRQAPTKDYYIVGDGGAQATMLTRVNNVGLKLRYVHQRAGGDMKPGERRSFINLLYADRSNEPKGYELVRLGPSEGLVLNGRGAPVAYFGCGQSEETSAVLPIRAPMFLVTPERAAIVDGTRAGSVIKSDEPTSTEARDEGGELADALAKLGRRAASLRESQKPLALARPAVPGLRRLWTLADADESPVADLVFADVNRDGKQELIAAKGTRALCIGADGNVLWEYPCSGPATVVWAADINGDGRLEVLVGSDDEHVYVLDDAGKELSRHHMDLPLRVGTSSVRYPRLRTIVVDDLEGDGKPDIIIGTANGNLARYDANFNLVWAYNRIEHGTRTGECKILDINGDGKKEILVANRYGSVEINDADGNVLPNVYSELGDVEFDIGDLDGDGKIEIVNGSSTGALKTTEFGGKVEWEFSNFGFGACDVRVADVDGDGKLETILASETGYVYILDGAGELKAQADLGEAQRMLAIGDLDDDGEIEIVTGGDDKRITVLTGSAQIKRAQEMPGYVSKLWMANVQQGQRPIVVVATKDGGLTALAAE